MTDEQILDSVRDGLAGARMHRPVDDILRRGRTRRRRARAVTAVAGVALFAGVTFAAVPHDRSVPVASGSSPSTVTSLKPVSFTLAQGKDGTYTFDVVPGVPLDTAAVEQALKGIGITAVVRIDERCMGQPFEPFPEKGFIRFATKPDGSVSIIIDARKISPRGTLALALAIDSEGRLGAASMGVFATGTQQHCSKLTLFPSAGTSGR